MATEKRLVYATDVKDLINGLESLPWEEEVDYLVDRLPKADAVEVVHGRWEQEIGDLHHGGVLYYCSVCNKLHFVKARHSLISLSSHEELFSKPNYCPYCGAKMDGDGNG